MSAHVIADAVLSASRSAYPCRFDRRRLPAGRGTGRGTWHR